MRITPLITLMALLILVPVTSAAAAPEKRIINGYEGPYVPWQVALSPLTEEGFPAFDETGVVVFCGGTLRDATHVITAAHCVPDTNPGEIAVVAGMYDRSTAPGDGAQFSVVSEVSSHPAYGDAAEQNDLAVLTLEAPLAAPGSGDYPLATLPVTTESTPEFGKFALISGWGDIDPDPEGQTQPDRLSTSPIFLLENSDCDAYNEESPGTFVPSVMLCAGAADSLGPIDTCQGDSGGPLALTDSEDPQDPSDFDRLVGVVSFGFGCALPDFPGIYTNLYNSDLKARATDPSPPARLVPAGPPNTVGSGRAGQALGCTGDAWNPAPTERSIAWFSFVLNGDEVSDVVRHDDGDTFTPSAEMVGRYVICSVRAKNDGGAREQQAETAVRVAPAAPTVPTQPPVTPTPGPPTPLPQVDVLSPTSAVTSRKCKKRRCSLTITGSDANGPAVAANVRRQRISGCKKGRKGKKCRKAVSKAATPVSPGVFTFKTPKLRKALYRFTVVTTDAAGNRSEAVKLVLRVK